MGRPRLFTLLFWTLIVAILLPSVCIGWVGYRFAASSISAERIATVGRIGELRHRQLNDLLNTLNRQSAEALSSMSERCSAIVERNGCLRAALETYLQATRAQGATLHRDAGQVALRVGIHPAADDAGVDFAPQQLAWLSPFQPGQPRWMVIRSRDPALQTSLITTYSVEVLQPVFSGDAALGDSGETFLSDAQGFFVTRPRYGRPDGQGHSHPIAARPMLACLAGITGQALDLDYREASIIHGFRPIPEVGGGCIMAHADQAEAFAPLQTLRLQMLLTGLSMVVLAVLAAVLLARRLVRPINSLASITRRIGGGDFSASAEGATFDEAFQLASAINLMAQQIKETLSQLQTLQQQLLATNAMLSDLSHTDGLTGLANRRRFDAHLQAEINRAGRDGSELACILLDVDHFKAYNDRFGHLAGDDCLRRVAAALEACAKRSGELVARYGGEEFAIILPGSTLEQASAIAQAALQTVRELEMGHEGEALGGVTISAGVASLRPRAREDGQLLLDKADQALYQAKHEGRNRVAVATS